MRSWPSSNLRLAFPRACKSQFTEMARWSVCFSRPRTVRTKSFSSSCHLPISPQTVWLMNRPATPTRQSFQSIVWITSRTWRTTHQYLKTRCLLGTCRVTSLTRANSIARSSSHLQAVSNSKPELRHQILSSLVAQRGSLEKAPMQLPASKQPPSFLRKAITCTVYPWPHHILRKVRLAILASRRTTSPLPETFLAMVDAASKELISPSMAWATVKARR